MDPYSQIIYLLQSKNINYQEFFHEPVFTSEEASRVRDIPQAIGAKSLLLRLKFVDHDQYVLTVIPGEARLDNKKIRQLFGVKDFSFASPEKVLELIGCEIGAVYPIASIPKLELYVDMSIKENEKLAFNPGRHDRTIIMSVKDYLVLEGPKLKEIIK